MLRMKGVFISFENSAFHHGLLFEFLYTTLPTSLNYHIVN